MTTLYIRHPARPEAEGAAWGFALVGDSGSVVQQGGGSLKGLADLVASSRRVVLMLPAAATTIVHVKVPPLPAAKLKAALPGLVEEHILSDPLDCALVVAPTASPDGTRAIAVVQRAWLEARAKALFELGARSVSAVPLQLCLPLAPGGASALVDTDELAVRTGLFAGFGLAMAGGATDALRSAGVFAGDAPLTAYAAPSLVDELRASEAAQQVQVEELRWPDLIAGSKTTTLDMAQALGSSGKRATDWRRWRWPLRLAIAAVVVNLFGLNVEYQRLKREAAAVRQSMITTFNSVYPKEPVSNPVLQMRRNVERARAATGEVGPGEFTWLAARLGEAAGSPGRRPAIKHMAFRDGALQVKVDAADPGMLAQLQNVLSAQGLQLSESSPGTWELRSKGGAK